MAINFPSPANPGDIYSYNGYIWEYVSGGYWKSVTESDYIYSATTSGTGTSVIADITGGNLYLKSFSGNNISISESNGVLTFSAGSSSVSGDYLPLSGGTVTGATNYTAGLTANTLTVTGNTTISGVTTSSTFLSSQSVGDEGGQIDLAKSQTNTTLSGSTISIDIYQNKLRFFESGGNNRGAYIDLSKASNGVSSDLLVNSNYGKIYTTGNNLNFI